MLALGIFGPPVADELILLCLGYLVLKGALAPVPTATAVAAGTLAGIGFNYVLGRTLGHYLLQRPDTWLHGKCRRIFELQRRLADANRWVLACSSFVPGWRHCAPIVAGLSCLDFSWFVILTFSGGLVWSLSYILLGYWLGESFNHEFLQTYRWLIVMGVLLSGGLVFTLRRKKAGWA